MVKNITIFTTNTCAYCKMVKQFLNTKGFSYDEINLDDQPEKQQEDNRVKNTCNQHTAKPFFKIRCGQSQKRGTHRIGRKISKYKGRQKATPSGKAPYKCNVLCRAKSTEGFNNGIKYQGKYQQ